MTVLAINAWDEDESVVRQFASEGKLKHRILLDGGSVARDLYGIEGLPITLWIDRNGVVVEAERDVKGFGSLDRKTRQLLERSD